jgi:hypothetical protein
MLKFAARVFSDSIAFGNKRTELMKKQGAQCGKVKFFLAVSGRAASIETGCEQ